MLHTILTERFAMANTIKTANEEIQKVRAIADAKGQALREKENQFQETNKIIGDLNKVLSDLKNNNRSLETNSSFINVTEQVNNLIVTKFALTMSEPTTVLTSIESMGSDHNRLLSVLRERTEEIDILKGRLIDIEKSGIKN